MSWFNHSFDPAAEDVYPGADSLSSKARSKVMLSSCRFHYIKIAQNSDELVLANAITEWFLLDLLGIECSASSRSLLVGGVEPSFERFVACFKSRPSSGRCDEASQNGFL